MGDDPAGGVTFAGAAAADVPTIAAFMRALRAEDPFPDGAVDGPAAAAALARLVGDPVLGRAWVIRADGAPIGYVVVTLGYSIEFGGRTAFVDELYVRPAGRGRGAGRRALAAVADWARAAGVRVVFLEVSPSNDAARRLYASAGFSDRAYRLMARPID